MLRTTVREVTPEDIGWLAGIIDGEGSITVVSSHTLPRKIIHKIIIIATDLTLMNKCVRIIQQFDDGMGWSGKPVKIYKKVYKKNFFTKTPKQCYAVEIWRQGVLINVLEAVLPHLTEKYLKGARLLNFLKNHKKGGRFREGEIDAYLSFTPAETK